MMNEYIDFFSNNPMLSIAWLAIAAMLVHSFVKDKLAGVKSVTAQQATLMINKQNAIVVYVRSSDEYKKGHIVNAKNLTLSQIEQGHFSGIENHKETPIVLVCDSGSRSATAAAKLAKAGFTQVHNLLAGMSGWREANLPTTKK
jgi:rhodanese-related sulfurtransferase